MPFHSLAQKMHFRRGEGLDADVDLKFYCISGPHKTDLEEKDGMRAAVNEVCYLELSVFGIHVEEGVVGNPVAVVVYVNGPRHT